MDITELRYIKTSKNEKGKWAWKGKFACFNIKEKGKWACYFKV